MRNKNLIVMIVLSLSILVLFGTSYAYLITSKIGNNGYAINVGNLSVVFKDSETNALNLSNMYPMSDEEGVAQEEKLEIVVTNNGNITAGYSLYIEETSTDPEFKSVMKYASNKNDTGYKSAKTLGTNKYIDYYGRLNPEEDANYKVKVWLGENADNSYMSVDTSKKTFTAKVVIEANQVYTDGVLNGADPVLTGKLIPVVIDDGGKVTYADTRVKWYDYEEKNWANAVILVDSPSTTYKEGDIIDEKDIESYFVWIPRFKYKLWNANPLDGAYNLNQIVDESGKQNILTETQSSFRMMFGNTRLIEIEFENKDTKKSENTTNGQWLTHPAFTLNGKELNGIWVGKFETGYNQGDVGKPIADTTSWTTTKAEVNKIESDKIIVKPDVYSWRNSTVSNFFKSAYDYNRDLDSHMMKNIEWGAVAYLSHSLYGIGKEININNNNQYKTGYSAVIGTDQSSYTGTSGNTEKETLPYNTPTGYLASTTGNITGVYDMSGGAHEYMAAYSENASNCSNNTGDCSGFTLDELTKYDAYLDKYLDTTGISYSKRILGDATGEMGPFYHYFDKDNSKRYHNAWYADYSGFVDSTYPWFARGGNYTDGVLAGPFYFDRGTGTTHTGIATRLVVTGI